MILLIILASYQKYRENIVRSVGNWEAKFICIEYSDALEIEKDDNIKEISIYYDYGMSNEDVLRSENRTCRIQLFGYDENALKNSKITLIKGELPQNSNEIILSKNIELNDIELGDEIELTFEGNTKKYKIVGIAEKIEEEENYNVTGSLYSAITLLEANSLQKDTIVNVSVITNHIRKIYKTVNTLEQNLALDDIPNISKITSISASISNETKNELAKLGISSEINLENEVDEDKIKYNEDLLEILGVSKKRNTFYQIFLFISILCIIIVSVAGIAELFTLFMLTYSERKSDLERLSSLGMSYSRRKNNVLKRSRNYWDNSVLSWEVQFGYLVALFVIKLLGIIIPHINIDSFTNNNVMFTMNCPLYLLILVAIIIYIIVIMAVLLPLRKIKNANIIEGIKKINKRKNKEFKTPFIINKIFKEEGVIAYKYNKREKIKHTAIVFSLTLNICVFLITSGIIMNFLKDIDKLNYDDYAIEVQPKDVKDVVNYLENNDLLDSYFVQTDGFQVVLPENTSPLDLHIEVPKDKVSDIMLEVLENTNQTYNYSVLAYYFDENTYNNILEKAGINKLNENECILINTQQVEDSIYGSSFDITKYVIGDTINILGDINGDIETLCNLNIAGIIDSLEPYEQTDYKLSDYNATIQLVLNKDMLEKEMQSEYVRSTIYIATDIPYEIDEKIDELRTSMNISISGENLYEERLSEESLNTLLKFILYTFSVMTILFCIIYMFNVISSSIILRKRDFAILKSIGMSQKQVDKMLILECLFYGFSAIIFGIIFSFVILYILGKVLINSNLYIFKLPFIHIIYVIFITYFVILLGMLSARRKIKYNNIIETIKNQNI